MWSKALEIYNPYEAIKKHQTKSRIAQLKAMHELMLNANDKDIYMRWIYFMPDEPTEEDFEYIAGDAELYNKCFNLFVRLIAKKGNRW